MEDNKKVLQEDEIDLIKLVKVIWSKKWFIAKVTGVFIILGLIIAFTSPKEYETKCILIPESVESGGKLGGSLGGLASLAGVDLGGLSQGVNTINPELYRSVAQSTPFLLELMQQKFYFADVEKTVSLYDYYIDYYKTSLISKAFSIPNKLISLVKFSNDQGQIEFSERDKTIISLSLAQQEVINNLSDRILVTMDWDLNVVSIEVEMQDPLVAAQMTEFTRKYITKYVTDYSVSKSQEQLKFVESQYVKRKKEFEQAQLRLATFRDRNTNVNSARARSEEEQLQSDYNLTFSIYNQLAQQQESIKLQVNENTPVFTVLEPAQVPVKKSKPKRIITIVLFLIMGLFVSSFTIILKESLT